MSGLKFYMPSQDEESQKWAERYTRSIYSPASEDSRTSGGFGMRRLKKYIEEGILYDPNFRFRKADGTELESYEDSVKLIYCLSCDKERINNWRRYCSEDCPYYISYI